MMFALLIAQQAFAGVGPFESAQMDGTAHAPRQGDIFLKPFGDSSLGLTDRLAVATNAVDWVQGNPNVSSEFNIIDNWDYALSVTPYASTTVEFDELRVGATLLHSLQYAEDRLNTSVRVGFVGQPGTEAALELGGVASGILEGEVGLSYDIVASRSVVHRFKTSISGSMQGLDSLTGSAGYSLHAAIGESARLELGLDVGQPSSVAGDVFNAQLREVVYGEELSGQSWMPTPSASLFWVF